MTTAEFDVLIAGAGFVGSTLALALRDSGLRIGLIESSALQTDSQPGFDDRGIALSYGSQRILETMQLWPLLAGQATAIEDIHVSDRGHFGVTRLSAAQEKVPALGQVLTAKDLGRQLNRQLLSATMIKLFCPATIQAIEYHPQHITVRLNSGQQLRSRLLVGADGQFSAVRQLLGLSALQRDYQQTAITANVLAERPHNNRAYERFTDAGPLALLPLSEQRMSLVWTVRSDTAPELLQLDDTAFLARLQYCFGYRLGQFKQLGQRHSYPLTLLQTDQPVQPRTVLIGNAAHSLHPIAGQGFNLGLRDVAVLAEMLVSHAEDCGHSQVLFDYQAWRQQDQDRVINATDRLVRWFSNDNLLLGHGRSAALALLDLLPPAKHWLARQSMGLQGRLPKLARGLPL